MSAKSFSNPKTAVGTLLAGVSIIALSVGLPGWLGLVVDPGTAFFLTLTTGVGGLATLGGFVGLQQQYSIAQRRRETAAPSGTFGSARFATLEELDAAQLFDPNGLYLGWVKDRKTPLPLFYSGKAHLLTCAPARQGKGIGVVIPNLLHYPGSVVVTDPKGELAATTSAHRRERMGHDVAVFNPWRLHGLPQTRINPFDPLAEMANDPALQRGTGEEATAIALQLLPEPADERNKFFRDGARTILRAGLLYLAFLKPEACTLTELWTLVYNPVRLERMAEELDASEACGGMLSTLGANLAAQISDGEGQFADFRTSAVQAVDI